MKVDIGNYHQEEKVGEIDEDGNLETESGALREVAEPLIEEGVYGVYPFHADGREGGEDIVYREFHITPGTTGWLREFFDNLPSPYDCDMEVLGELPTFDPDEYLEQKMEKEWVEDPTEEAPNRWTHTETGEHRYQETKPEPGEGGEDTSSADVSDFDITDTWDPSEGVMRSIEALEAGVPREEVLEEFKSKWNRAGEELGETMLENSMDETPLLSEVDSRIDDAQEKFKEENPEAYEEATEAISTWQTTMFDETAAPIWQYAAQVTGNENIGEPEEYDGVPLGTDVDEEQMEAVKKLHEHTVETLRETYGDQFVVFRGVSGSGNTSSQAEGTDLAEQLTGAASSDENVEVQHRPLESWTINPSYAAKYAQDEENGAVIADTISPEDVLVSSLSGAGKIAPHENEMVIMNDEKEYKPEQIMSGDESEEELFDMYFHAAAELIEE